MPAGLDVGAAAWAEAAGGVAETTAAAAARLIKRPPPGAGLQSASEQPSAQTVSTATTTSDRLTGVRPWFKPFDVEYEFTYVGIGKKGGY